MQKGFQVLKAHNSYNRSIIDNMVVVPDQKVPQSVYAMENDIYSSHHEEFNNMPNILGLEEFSQLEPVAPTVCETNNDQRVYESDSPKSLLDLDSISGHQSFYGDEPALNIKIEKDIEHVSYSCSMHNINSSYQMYNPSQMLVKEEPDPVEDIGTSVIRHLKEEINNTCCILRISTDPMMWSTEDVRKWFVWHAQQFGVHSEIHEQFAMKGEHLCQLTEENFKERCPEAGSNFYGQLDVWKTVPACSLQTEDCPPSPPQHQIHCYSYRDYYDNSYDLMSYMPTSTSPAPSEDSIDSTTSSSNVSYIPPSCHDEEYMSYSQSPPLSSPVETQHHKQTIHLWQFLKDLLLRPDRYNSCIKWIDRQRGIFKIEDSSKVAKLWGLRKNRPAMNYDKLSRSIRQYYKKGIIKKTEHSKRLVYQFCQPYL